MKRRITKVLGTVAGAALVLSGVAATPSKASASDPTEALDSEGSIVLDLLQAATLNDPVGGVPDGAVPVGVPQGIEWDVETLTVVPGASAIALSPDLSYVYCWAASHNPHQSYTEHGYVHAKGKLDRCSAYPSYLYIDGLLTRDRWYGEQGLSRTPASDRRGTGSWRQDIRKWRCAGVGTYTYHLYNYHQVGGYPSSQYTHAYTANSNRFTC